MSPRLTHLLVLSVLALWRVDRSSTRARSFVNQNAEQPSVFQKADRADAVVPPYKFSFAVQDCRYSINEKGKGSRSCASTKRSFQLPVERDSYIEHIYYFGNSNALLVIYELTDEEAGWGTVVSYDRSTLRARWKLHIPDFNIGQSLVEGTFAYVTGIGFIAKLYMRKGRFVWQQKGLYRRKISLESFSLPQLEGNTVVFTSQDAHGNSRTIRVDKLSGRIIEHH